MDWYFDFVLLFVTFCVIAIGMTVYVRKYSNHARYNKYVYTGSIPKITITTCEDMPNPCAVPAAESSDSESNDQEDSSPSIQDNENFTETCLAVPVLDDDFDDEEEQQQAVEVVEIESIPLVDSKTEEKQNVIVTHPEKEEIVSQSENKLDNDAQTETIVEALVIQETKDIPDGEVDEKPLSDTQVLEKSLPKDPYLVNGFTWKYGTSHTVEDPLFPFSHVIDDEQPLVRNRFKKRLSQ